MTAALKYIFVLAILFTLPLPAENSASDSGSQLPPVVEQPVVPAPQNDRKSGQGAAAAAAAAAAGMQGLTCMMMMKEARETGDKMMMMMAMQQCAQAAQTAANAAQNKEGEKKLSEPQQMKMGELKPQPLKIPEAPKDEKLMEMAKTEATPDDVPADLDLGEYQGPVIEDAQPTAAVSNTSPVQTGSKTVNVGLSVPSKIDRAKLGYDESGNTSQNPTPTRELPFGTTVTGARSGTMQEMPGERSALNGFVALDQARRKRGGRGNGEALEGSGADSAPSGRSDSEKSESGNGALDSMLAMLGGQGSQEAGMPVGSDILVASGKNADQGGQNIFEYATSRYCVLVDDGAIRAQPKGRAALVTRADNP